MEICLQAYVHAFKPASLPVCLRACTHGQYNPNELGQSPWGGGGGHCGFLAEATATEARFTFEYTYICKFETIYETALGYELRVQKFTFMYVYLVCSSLRNQCFLEIVYEDNFSSFFPRSVMWYFVFLFLQELHTLQKASLIKFRPKAMAMFHPVLYTHLASCIHRPRMVESEKSDLTR